MLVLSRRPREKIIIANQIEVDILEVRDKRVRMRIEVTRHRGQKITVGHGVSIEVCEFNGRQVRLGIRGPRDISVNRADVQNMINASQSGVQSNRGVHLMLIDGEYQQCITCGARALGDVEPFHFIGCQHRVE